MSNSHICTHCCYLMWSFWVIRVGILTQFAKPIKLTLIGTCLIFYGTFKSHESHCNKHIFKCYRRPVTEWSFCMHSYNQIYHYGSIACLGVEILLQIKKLWGKRCFYTVFQECYCYSVTYLNCLFKSGFSQRCKVFSGNFIWYEVHRKDYHGNIRSLLQGKQPQYRLKFDQMLQCDIFGLG